MTDFREYSQDTALRTASTSRVKPVTRLAWLIVAYNTAVILWGAYLRASGSGAGCGSRWPSCHGHILPLVTGDFPKTEASVRAGWSGGRRFGTAD
jgi:heme A synthase